MKDIKVIGAFIFFLLFGCCFTATAQGGFPDYQALKEEQAKIPEILVDFTCQFKVCQTACLVVETAASVAEQSAKVAELQVCFEKLQKIGSELGRIASNVYIAHNYPNLAKEAGWTDQQLAETKDWWDSLQGNIVEMNKLQEEIPGYDEIESLARGGKIPLPVS